MQKGQKLPPKQRIKIELPEGFLETGTTTQGIPKARIVGATAAGVGAYLMVRVLQKTLGEFFKELPKNLGILALTLSPLISGFEFKPGLEEEQEQLLALDPMATATGLLVGGLVMADINPGEILKGIGEIIPG